MAVKKALEADPVNITEISNRVKGHPF
jgi:hypothetical protein